MNSEPDQIDMMDADELRVELRKLVKQITPPPERGSQPHSVGWSDRVNAGDALSLALTALQHGIGCGCGGGTGHRVEITVRLIAPNEKLRDDDEQAAKGN
jgi:hypothetical protein